jgi:histidinol-phosphate aminotransferase
MRENIETLKASQVKLLSGLHSPKVLSLGRAIDAQNANFILIPVLARGGSVADSTRAQCVYLTLAEKEGVVVRYREARLVPWMSAH